jgi:hypothetical protein
MKGVPVNEQLSVQHILDNRAALLAELARRQAVVRDYVRGVGRQYSTGLYLYGPPGTGKTHTVRAVLDNEIREIYAYKRGHVTPLGLFELLAEHRDEVVVLDDLSSVFRSPTALQVLLAALEHPSAADFGRPVECRRQGRGQVFSFQGGIICISNLELHDHELLSAFKSGVHVLNYAPTDAQVGALMLAVADQGWPIGAPVQTISPEQAGEIATFVMAEMLRVGCRFDLRVLFDKAYQDYQQWRDNETESDWRDLVVASIEECLVTIRQPGFRPLSREARLEEERAVVRELLRQHDSRKEQVNAWTRRTGNSERAFYRRLAEIKNH